MRSAFKEWAVVVDALGRGEQILILRKGGLAEGPGGFQVEQREFLLLPTRFHQQRERVLPAAQLRYDELAAEASPAADCGRAQRSLPASSASSPVSPRPGCSGPNSSSIMTSGPGWTAIRASPNLPLRGNVAATRSGVTSTIATSFRCPTSGSTRGTRRGTSPST
jgi:hypothetical protein